MFFVGSSETYVSHIGSDHQPPAKGKPPDTPTSSTARNSTSKHIGCIGHMIVSHTILRPNHRYQSYPQRGMQQQPQPQPQPQHPPHSHRRMMMVASSSSTIVGKLLLPLPLLLLLLLLGVDMMGRIPSCTFLRPGTVMVVVQAFRYVRHFVLVLVGCYLVWTNVVQQKNNKQPIPTQLYIYISIGFCYYYYFCWFGN
jgi:hypothetical protein